jgi:hypothetical protein
MLRSEALELGYEPDDTPEPIDVVSVEIVLDGEPTPLDVEVYEGHDTFRLVAFGAAGEVFLDGDEMERLAAAVSEVLYG